MHTDNISLYDLEWGIKDGILYSYTGKKKENVVVPMGVKEITFNPFEETIETLKMPKSLISLNPGINAKKVHIFGNTKIDFKVINTREKIEELVIYNNGNEETILDNLKQKLEKPYYLTKLKRIILRGNHVKEEYIDKFELMMEKLSKLDIDLTLPKEFEIKDAMLIAYNGENTNIIIPEGIRIIDSNAFYNHKLKSVILPESLETIRDKAFANNDLEKLTIPSSVKFISESAFFNNPKLKEIEISVNEKNLLLFNIPSIEHLTLNCSNIDSFTSIERILKLNKSELNNLKTLTIKNFRIPYFKLKDILKNLDLINIEVQISNNEMKGNSYRFIKGKLNSMTINKSSYDSTYLEALNECYKLYINNLNGKGVEEFIDFIKLWCFNRPKELGMIIIKGQNISLLKKLALNKLLGKTIFYDFEPSDELETANDETIEIDNSIEDEEISKLLDEIISILNSKINNEDKNKILILINNIINKYKQQMQNLKPKLFNEKPIFGEETITPESLRFNLILELNDIIIRLKNNDVYLNLRKEISELEELTKQPNIKIPEVIESIKDKVKYITVKSQIYEKCGFLKELQTIFNDIKKQISNNIISLTESLELVNELPIEKILDIKIDTLYEKAKKISEIEDAFNDNNSELAKDINTVKMIIANFSIEHQNIFKNKLNSIINKYYQELITGERNDLNETILEIRKEWHPLLKELSIKSYTYTKYKELIDELNNEKNDKVSTIEILINEIENLKDNSSLDDLTKSKINIKLETIINTWKTKLNNNYEIEDEEDIFEIICKNNNLPFIPRVKNSNSCVEIEIQITKELLELKEDILTFINEKEEYEKLTKVMKNIKISG